MTLKLKGSVETVQDVEKLIMLIRRGYEEDEFYWAGYAVLIAMEEYWTGFSMDPDKDARVERLIKSVNEILAEGLFIPPEDRPE